MPYANFHVVACSLLGSLIGVHALLWFAGRHYEELFRDLHGYWWISHQCLIAVNLAVCLLVVVGSLSMGKDASHVLGSPFVYGTPVAALMLFMWPRAIYLMATARPIVPQTGEMQNRK